MSGPDPLAFPAAVASLLAALDAHGFPSHVVGPAAEALVNGRSATDFEVSTPADAGSVATLFPNAVTLDSARRRFALPTAAGPVDLVPRDDSLREALGRRDFTLHALAIDAAGVVTDPFGGRDDLDVGVVRCVGDPLACFARDPLRRLRALRLVATRGFTLDPAAETVLGDTRSPLAGLPASRIRAEVHALLLGDHVARGLAGLRRTGLEADLADGVEEDAASVVSRLPADLALRLAGWLRGARAVRSLRRMREPRARVQWIERLLQLHPIDALARPDQEGRVARLARRSASLVPGLLALREAEIAARDEGAAARESLDALRKALEGVRDADPDAPGLALDGRAVMEILGCGPGPAVGRALRQLEKDVAADPACNTPEGLRERLLLRRASRHP